MCGIVGIARAAGARELSRDDVRRMASTIVHRGPDDEGIHADHDAIIGMRRLSIIDLSGGHQPISNEDGTLWLVCNGEIYNFQSLRRDLIARGHTFRTGSDVEVLLHLYEEHGDRFVEHVEGMYGAALWDAKRRRLVLLRDRLGQKPLYYTVAGGRLAFGSELKSLLTLDWVDRSLDQSALREFLALGYAVAPRTMHRAIRKLPPASMAVWEDGRLQVSSYWQLPTAVDAGATEAAVVESVRTELDRAVREHMISDVPIGAFLSGGVDSSAVVALMARYSDRPVNTYSIGYAGKGAAEYYNELSFAAVVAKRFGTNHTEIPVEPDVAALLPKLLWHVEEPISDSAMLTTYLVSMLAARDVKVILSGVGGDELFAGYRRYLGGHYGRQYARLPAWLRRGIVAPVARRLPSGRQSRLADLSRYARRFVEASELPPLERYRRYVEICSHAQVDALLDGGAPGGDGARDGFALAAAGAEGADSLLSLMRVDAPTQLAEDLLLLTDKVTMAASIECRVPFLDRRLVEVAARIPEAIKLRDGELKRVLRRAVEGLVPTEVLDRSKRGFGAPVGSWLKTDLRHLRDELLSPARVAARGLVRPDAVRRVVADHDSGREDYSDLLLVLINLEIWGRLFVDGASADDLSGELTELARAA
jgi:asparagine synthase (glutamine-hydrolysing)